MKIAFPIMGNSYIAFKQLIKEMGHEPVVEPMISAKTMSLGVAYSPEFACIPFKILLGSYLEAIEKGAEVIITSGGHGPCRAGYYGILHQKIIQDLGYDTKVVVFDSFTRNIGDYIRKLNWLLTQGKTSWWKFYKGLQKVWLKIKVLDELEILSHNIRPYEINKGETTKVYKKCLELVDETKNKSQILEAKDACIKMLKNISQDRSRKPLKIGVVGEIYVLIEPFANLDIQATLGEMGVYTERSMYLAHWLRENSNKSHHEKDVIEAAQPYLREKIGGHGINSIGETIMYAKRGFDGIIQMAPFSCIPEIVAKGILPRISQDNGIPVMTVFLDEQTGKAGLETRLEAFADLLKQRRDGRLLKAY
ncbi:MAG: CoA protein activase [Clostridia bacterium]|nr:CoA protein activase [Clostridia bacterium]MDD4048936.1 CoA protein activase [Clostridia bacterium]